METSERIPRVAFFTDSFHEVNGVANVSRRLEAFAQSRGFPFCSVHAGPETSITPLGSVTRYELKRGRRTWQLDNDLAIDPLLWRRYREALEPLRAFGPDLVHITGPGDVGVLGLIVAKTLRVPLVASWHTNLHEYAGSRSRHILRFLPGPLGRAAARAVSSGSMAALVRFYRTARITLAPNLDMVGELGRRTGRPCFLMQRGVDAEQFHPRQRASGNGKLNLGFVGRLSIEKNVRLLASVERGLLARGIGGFRMTIVGQGGERDWLERNLQRPRFMGVLRGEALAQAYANMDLFLFPSETDAFGNVVLEAMACGTPAVVMKSGGPKYLLTEGASGFVAATAGEFVDRVAELVREPERLTGMREAARRDALRLAWEGVLGGVYDAYRECLRQEMGIDGA